MFSILLFCLESCAQINGKERLYTYDKFRTQHLEYRDSLFIFYTIQKWHDSNFDVYENLSKMYRATNDQIQYFNGGVFYSPDKLKIIIWEVEQNPNAASIKKYTGNPLNDKICPQGKDTVYGSAPIIGFRKDTSDVWIIYPFGNQLVGCYYTQEEVINVLGQYYFEKMKGHAMWRLMQTGPEAGKNVLSPYGYNLQDEDFWDKCWLWEKDTIAGNGLYPFQIRGYDAVGYNEKIGYGYNEKYQANPIKLPIIEYPKEILALYGK